MPDDLALGASLYIAVLLARVCLEHPFALEFRTRIPALIYHLMISLIVPHPRVDEGVRDVREEVTENHESSPDKQERTRHVEVSLVEGVEKQEPQTRPGKNRLGDYSPAEDEPDTEGHQGHGGKQSVPQRVLEIDHPLGESLRPCGPEVVRSQHVQHGTALEPAELGDADHGERYDREGEMLQKVHDPSAIRTGHPRDEKDTISCPAREVNAQNELENEPQPEGRHAVTHEREKRASVVQGAVLFYRRVDAKRDGDQDRYYKRGSHQQDGRPYPEYDNRVDRRVLLETRAKVSMKDDIPYPDAILDG